MSEVPRLMSRSSGLIWEHIHPHECISLPISNTGCPDERKKAYFANQFRKTFFTNIYHPFNTTVNTLHKQRRYMPMPISAWHIYIILIYPEESNIISGPLWNDLQCISTTHLRNNYSAALSISTFINPSVMRQCAMHTPYLPAGG